MDLGILFGFLGTWLLIALALLGGGDLGMFVDPTSVILVVGASATVVFYSIPARNVKGVFKVIQRLLFHKPRSLDKLIEDMVSYAEVARRDGILSLENAVKEIDDPFIVTGIQMAVDGTDPELIEQIMESELESLSDRHAVNKGIFPNE